MGLHKRLLTYKREKKRRKYSNNPLEKHLQQRKLNTGLLHHASSAALATR
jgi:hypothetical protein